MFWKFKERAEWLACVDDLLPHRAVQQMTGLPQHRAGFSCGHHSLLVSYTSFCLCRRLGWNAREAARGGLLHDLYLYDWTDRGLHGAWDHLRNHPGQALRNAEERFDLTERERDIIATHMFPLTWTPYHFRESFAVSTMDKVCAVLELLGILPDTIPAPYVLPAPPRGEPAARGRASA
ncbi:MAG: phosphohydrolase [Clostridiales bacterium]|nr:phosphohydrolase [Clostridiales bacterium]